MAALVEGHQYGLSSENSTSGQKSVVHVKLTDSALKALEGFQKIKVLESF
jgi:RNA polymerase II elongation factor ELL